MIFEGDKDKLHIISARSEVIKENGISKGTLSFEICAEHLPSYTQESRSESISFIMNAAIWLTVAVLFYVASTTCGYNMLMIMPCSGKSHVIAFEPIAEELAKRGHQVTIASPIKQSSAKKQRGVEHVYLELIENAFEKHQYDFFKGDMSDDGVRNTFLDLMQDLATFTYQEPIVQDVLRNPRDAKTGRPRYDLLIVDTIFNEFTLPLAYHMGVPSVYFGPGTLMPEIAYAMDIPFPLSYVPALTTYSPTTSMGFFERANNLFATVVFFNFRYRVLQPFYEQLIAQYLPNSPPLTVLENNVSFLLQNMKIPLTRSAPSMPYYADVGTVHCKPVQKLPQDLEDFMQSSGDAGVIYFSLGSYTKGASMPLSMRDKALEVFAQLPQKVLWKYEKDIKNLPKNVKLVKWIPQQDLLGHPKLRLFISHGGSLSTQESAYHGCPMLAFPLSDDQMGNIANAEIAGMAEQLNWRTFTVQELLDKVTRLVNDERYKENAMKVSSILRDTIVEPKVTAAYWIEYVIRHRGAHHLKSGARHLNFFQHFMLDIIGSVVLCLLLVLLSVIYTIKLVLGLLRKSLASAKKNQ